MCVLDGEGVQERVERLRIAVVRVGSKRAYFFPSAVILCYSAGFSSSCTTQFGAPSAWGSRLIRSRAITETPRPISCCFAREMSDY